MFEIERDITGLRPDERLAVRQEQSAPLLTELEIWLREERARLSRSAAVARPTDFLLKRRSGFARIAAPPQNRLHELLP